MKEPTRHLRPTTRPRIFHARMYFALQALVGAAWWLGISTLPTLRDATLGGIDPVLASAVHIPLFVIASAIVALNVRWAVFIVVPWTVLLTIGLIIYATVTAQAGLGAVLMVAASVGSVIAGILMLTGKVPSERLLVGPFAFRSSRTRVRSQVLLRTTVQLIVFWVVFLIIVPAIINSFEQRWELVVKTSILVAVAGFALLALSTVIGVWSARAIANFGSGTALPSEMANHLVVRGPYAFVRNPMAIAGLGQGVAVGLLFGSWMVIAYAVVGSLLWNWLVIPHEEDDLRQRFGAEYDTYCLRVARWLPRYSGYDSDAETDNDAEPDSDSEPGSDAETDSETQPNS